MIKMLKIIFLLSLVICFVNTQEKGCRMRDLDSKVSNLFGVFGMKSVKWSETEAEMDEWCRLSSRESNAAKSFVKKCLNGISKTLMSVSVYAGEKVAVKMYCNNKVERSKFMSRAKCGNKAKKDTIKCWNSLIDDINAVKNITETKFKIPAFCCQFYSWKKCSMNAYKEVGSPICSEKEIEGFEQHIDRGSLDPLNIFCSDYDDESDKCDQVLKNVPQIKSNNRKRDKTVFPGVVGVFDSL